MDASGVKKLRLPGALLMVEKLVRHETEGGEVLTTEGVVHRVKCVWSHLDLDIALLQIIGADVDLNITRFVSMLEVCPVNDLPMNNRLEPKAKLYHCPLSLFNSMRLPAVEAEPTDMAKLTFISNHYWFYLETTTMPGSSGGACVNADGLLIGVMWGGWTPDLPVTLTETWDADKMLTDDEEERTFSGKVSMRGEIAHFAKIIKFAHYAPLIDLLSRM